MKQAVNYVYKKLFSFYSNNSFNTIAFIMIFLFMACVSISCEGFFFSSSTNSLI